MKRKVIFDAIRTTFGRMTQSQVDYIDDAIDEALGLPGSDDDMTASSAGIDLIHSFESYAKKLKDGSVKAYPDPATGAEPFTIGWGSTTDENGKPIAPDTVWTRERADARFALDLKRFERAVNKLVSGTLTTQNQFDALVSFAYNLGEGNLAKSTLLRKHRSKDYEGAAREFARWNKANGKVMRGLTRRRADEAKLYRG